MGYPPEFIQYCASLALKLTSLRKEVLYILWRLESPLKAYDILDNLQRVKPNSKPTTVYRALDFFVASGIMHKLESIQSYTLCCEPEKRLPSEMLMVCNQCHQVIEVYDASVRRMMTNLAALHRFELKQDAIELKGVCRACQEKPIVN